MSEVKEYQSEIARMLRHIYAGVEVEEEWSSAFGAGVYSPRVDIAVGPFAVTHGESFIEIYDELMVLSQDFIRNMVRHHLGNIQQVNGQAPPNRIEEQTHRLFEELVNRNRNARCLMVIEIENTTSRKHLMGGAINAAALGRIGVAVAWTPDKLRAFANLKRYLDYLASVGKNTFDTANLLILDKDQFGQAVQDAVQLL
jgi:hypothetical protein